MQRQHPVELTAPRSNLRSLVPRTSAPTLEHTLVRPDDQLRLGFALMSGRIDRHTI